MFFSWENWKWSLGFPTKNWSLFGGPNFTDENNRIFSYESLPDEEWKRTQRGAAYGKDHVLYTSYSMSLFWSDPIISTKFPRLAFIAKKVHLFFICSSILSSSLHRPVELQILREPSIKRRTTLEAGKETEFWPRQYWSSHNSHSTMMPSIFWMSWKNDKSSIFLFF